MSEQGPEYELERVAAEADRQPIQSVRSFAAQAEAAHEAAGGLSCAVMLYLDMKGEYQFRRTGNHLACLGALRVLEGIIKQELMDEVEDEEP